MSRLQWSRGANTAESYENSGGGTTHAVQVVGIFDLPENRKP